MRTNRDRAANGRRGRFLPVLAVLVGVLTYVSVPVVHHLSLKEGAIAAAIGHVHVHHSDGHGDGPAPHDPSTCSIHTAYLTQLAGGDIPSAVLPELPLIPTAERPAAYRDPHTTAPDANAISPRGPPATSRTG
jgi:hypothetical protein